MDNKLKILEFLARNQDKKFTMHELSKLVAIPYATLFRELHNIGDLIKKDKVGKATTVQINLENPTVKHYLIIASDKKARDFEEKHPIFKKIRAEIPNNGYSVVLFGSFAKGTQTKTSE